MTTVLFAFGVGLTFLFSIGGSGMAGAAEKKSTPDCQPENATSTFLPKNTEALVTAAQAVADPPKKPEVRRPRWMNLQLVLDARVKGDAIEVTNADQQMVNADNTRVQSLLLASSGRSVYETGAINTVGGLLYMTAPAGVNFFGYRELKSEFTPANTREESLELLRNSAPSLSQGDRLLLLSMWGSLLSNGYDDSMPKFTSLDQVFNNARVGGVQGGVCRDIHPYLADVARALGFDSVATFTGLQGTGNKGGPHDIYYFRDRATGEFYVQNYGVILNTHQKSATGAVDIGTRAMGPLTTASAVESAAGRSHLYVPKLSRWISQEIKGVAEFKDQPLFTAKIGKREQAFGIQLSKKLGPAQVKGFYLHSDFAAADGPYKIDVAGVAGKVEGSKEFRNSVLDEVGGYAEAHVGYLKLENRQFMKPDLMQTRDSLAGRVAAGGFARINQVTGKIEFHAQTLDFPTTHPVANNSDNEIKAAVSYEPKGIPLKIEASRSAVVVNRDVQKVSYGLVTAHDKINVVVDNRGKDRKVYLESDSRLYALDGVDKLSAVGLQQVLKASIPTEKRGEFAVILDVSDIVANRKLKGGEKDAFYNVPLRASVKGQWRKALTKAIEIGADAGYTRGGDAFYLFEEAGSVTPDLRKRKKNEVSGSAWLRFKY